MIFAKATAVTAMPSQVEISCGRGNGLTHPKFPLTGESVYSWGINPKRDSSDTNALWLTVAQRALRVRWAARQVQPTGRYDLPTSEAVCRVQQAIGHKPDGELDKETWDAIFTYIQKDPLK